MAKRVSTRKIKKHRLYGYDEAGAALGVTPHTVRLWRSSGLSVMTSKILEGKLKAAGRLSDRFELNNLLINETDLKAAFPTRTRNGYTGTEACKRLSINFGTLHRLRDNGILKVRWTKSATSRMTNFLVTLESMADFEKRYFSLGMLRRCDLANRSLRVIDMELLDMEPLFYGVGLRRIYRWRDLPTDPIAELKEVELLRKAEIASTDAGVELFDPSESDAEPRGL